MSNVFVVTLGCPKNTVASNRLMRSLAEQGIEFSVDAQEADAIIVNTCGFIEAAKEESIECLLELGEKKQPGQVLVAIGCLAQRYQEELTKHLPEVDKILSFEQLGQLSQLLGKAGELRPGFQWPGQLPSSYLEISSGCDHVCSFCAIPLIHGGYKSRDNLQIIAEAGFLADQGCRELVFVGQDIGAYGVDLGQKDGLSDLIRGISQVDSIEWIRLMYLQWQHLNDNLLSEIATNAKVCDYLDLPFQHASENILGKMKRSGGAELYLAKIEQLRRYVPRVALRTSVIVGFPGETDQDFNELTDFIKAAEFDYLGVFEFSAEDGTPAAALDGQLSVEEKRGRAEQLRALADNLGRVRSRRFIGHRCDLLVEVIEGDVSVGRSWFQAPEVDGDIVVNGRKLEVGAFVPVVLESCDDYTFKGKLI